jgi:hypothetical protein
MLVLEVQRMIESATRRLHSRRPAVRLAKQRKKQGRQGGAGRTWRMWRGESWTSDLGDDYE